MEVWNAYGKYRYWRSHQRITESTEYSNHIDVLDSKAKTCEEIMDFTKKYEKLEGLTEFMDEMVEKITVYEDNRIEIVWRYGDEFENLGWLQKK